MNTAIRYVPLGYQQITSLSSAKGLTVPAGANAAIITAEAQGLRWRDDGTAPTASIGMTMAVGTILEYSGRLDKLELIEATSGGIANVSYYQIAG